jgi:predicted PurR-regulated permease PerM
MMFWLMTTEFVVPPEDPAPLTKMEAAEGPPPREGPPGVDAPEAESVRRSAWWWIRAGAVLGTVFLAYQLAVVFTGFLSQVFNIVLYLIFGAIVAFIAGPAVDALQRYARVPRTPAILIVLGGGLVVLAGLVYLVAGPIVEEARSLANDIPSLVRRGQDELNRFTSFLKSRNLPVSGIDLGGSEKALTSRAESVLLSSITGTVTAIVDVVIIFVVAFWLLKDGDKLRRGLLSILPGRLQVNVDFALDAVGVVIGGYVRAQLVLGMIIGLLAGVGCAIIGVPFPLVVGLAAGVFELIPIVGPFVGGAVAMLLAFTVSPGLALATLVLFLGIHIIEGYVLAPRIQARFVQLHPLIALLALFAGIQAGGFLGALFAVPAASLIAVFIRAAIGDWRATRPDLFAVARSDRRTEARRQRILREFRFGSPIAMVRGLAARRRHTPVGRRKG